MKNLSSYAVLLLAAGEGRRFGGEKLGAIIDGESVIALSASALANTGCVMRAAVLSSATLHHAPRLEALGFEILLNPDAASGLSSSIRCAVAWAQMNGADAALLALADMPFVTSTHLLRLCARLEHSTAGVAYSHSGNRCSPPAIFAARWFGALQSLDGDAGARNLLAAASDDDGVVAPPETLADIDSQEDLARFSR